MHFPITQEQMSPDNKYCRAHLLVCPCVCVCVSLYDSIVNEISPQQIWFGCIHLGAIWVISAIHSCHTEFIRLYLRRIRSKKSINKIYWRPHETFGHRGQKKRLESVRDIEFTRFFDFRFFSFYIVRCGYKPYRMPIASLKLENRICQIHKLTGNLNEIKIATHKSFGTKSIGNEYFTSCSSFRWAMRKKVAKCNGFSLCVCIMCAASSIQPTRAMSFL